MIAKAPQGTITRGTTNPNRLRRIDRFIARLPLLSKNVRPIVVDLGYGAAATTAVELAARLQAVNPAVELLGIEIDPERVAAAKNFESAQLHFIRGGFEIPLTSELEAIAHGKVHVIRALNVLRQYDESEVRSAWSLMQSRLTADGLLIEGTSDELGRIASWVTLDRDRPILFSVSLRLNSIELPSKVAERLPKVLIHKNVPGQPIHAFLTDLDAAWRSNAALGAFGATQRWEATCSALKQQGYQVQGNRKIWRLGEITVPWDAVAPK